MTSHTIDGGARWQWAKQPHGHDAIAGLAFADTPTRAESELGSEDIAPGEAVFLHPHRRTAVHADGKGVGICIWVPWNSVSEIEDGVQAPGQVMPSTPLTVGLRAFVASLLAQHAEPTVYTDYMVERVVVEMVFGVLLESVPKNITGTREVRPLDRARSLLLLRRGEPDFGVAELAQELHMSTRQVQRLFAAEGSTPADELRSMRIDLAAELLGDPNYDPLSITEIAEHAGFKTAAALRRAFAGRDLPLPNRVRRSREISI